MKFGLVNGLRQEAQPQLSGECPGCGRSMVAKCGEVRIWHWGHKGRKLCDPWWENETAWHRSWKDNFPADWQEIVHTADTGERHIADVKTPNDWVLEFQHSHISPEERRSRNAFYVKLAWVVDGTRLKRDRAQLTGAWDRGVPVTSDQLLRRVVLGDHGTLLEWADGERPVFFDLGDEKTLLSLLPVRATGLAYLRPILRAHFVEAHRAATPAGVRGFEQFVGDLPTVIAEYETRFRARRPTQSLVQQRNPRRHFRL